MTGFIGFVVYALVWWTVLFCVLPIGVRPQADANLDDGGWRGAPEQPMLWRKVAWTTLLSALIWLLIFLLVESDLISFRDAWLAIPD